MTLSTIAVLSAIALCVCLAVRSIARGKTGGCGCGGDCSKCSGCGYSSGIPSCGQEYRDKNQ